MKYFAELYGGCVYTSEMSDIVTIQIILPLSNDVVSKSLIKDELGLIEFESYRQIFAVLKEKAFIAS